MKAILIIPSTARHPQDFNSPSAIRYRIKYLSSLYGQVINLWPAYASAEYQQLSRKLRALESEGTNES